MDKIRMNYYVIPGIRLADLKFTKAKALAAIEFLTKHYKMSNGILLGESRKAEIVYVRHLLMYFCRKELRDGGVVEVGHALERDHTTVTYAVGQFQDRIDTNSTPPLKLKTEHTTTQGDYATTRHLLLQYL